MKDIKKILAEKSGINLDIGCGNNKMPGFVGIDYRPGPEVDIVWDIEKTPWPLPDACVNKAVASHVLEHIEPHGGIFIDVMNEIWRVMKPKGQFAFVVPYAGSLGFYQDPTHCNPINEATMYYFDPDPEGKNVSGSLYQFYQPKPWKIDFQACDRNGILEVLLTKRLDDPSFHEQVVTDLVKEKTGVYKAI